jgi:hypothetical protein
MRLNAAAQVWKKMTDLSFACAMFELRFLDFETSDLEVLRCQTSTTISTRHF